MFKQTDEYNVQMTNILLRLSNMEIKKQADYKEEGQIYSKFARSFGEGAKAQSKIVGQEQ